MKRFHVHVVVENIGKSIEFYSKLFGQEPAKQREDYAKWMLDDPQVNFAISTRGHATGVDHFGFQVDTLEQLAGMKVLAEQASGGEVFEQGQVTCCYAQSEKHWTIDPTGLAWEHFHTMADGLAFGNDTAGQEGACCIPIYGADENKSAPCCVPGVQLNNADACCD